MLWPLGDHLGTVRDILDSAGNVVNHLRYDSFGRITFERNTAADFLFAFTGRERDEESGLYYYRARYYDPEAGRFASEDPLGFAAGDTNIVRYVRNAPMDSTDPLGLEDRRGGAIDILLGAWRRRVRTWSLWTRPVDRAAGAVDGWFLIKRPEQPDNRQSFDKKLAEDNTLRGMLLVEVGIKQGIAKGLNDVGISLIISPVEVAINQGFFGELLQLIGELKDSAVDIVTISRIVDSELRHFEEKTKFVEVRRVTPRADHPEGAYVYTIELNKKTNEVFAMWQGHTLADPDPLDPEKPRDKLPFAFVFRGRVKIEGATAIVVCGGVERLDPLQYSLEMAN